ncbi:Solute carrier family 40 member 1 [Lamellibrachia satsuma]|nr:Solute carrier family 40 member 1 [Lamellibrachia satsuma]
MQTEKKDNDDTPDGATERKSFCVWLRSPSTLLYINYIVSAWGDWMWQFAVGLYLVHLADGELRLAAIFGFTAGGAVMFFGGIIGNWVDLNPRIKVVRVSLFIQNFSVVLCAIAVYFTLAYREQFASLFGGLLPQLCEGVIIFLAVIAQLASVAYKIAIEKDWIVVVAAGDNAKLANLNATIRAMDLLCNIMSPVTVGLVMTAASLTTAAIFIAAWNIFSVFVKYGLLSQVYRRVPQLAVKEGEDDTVSRQEEVKLQEIDDKGVKEDKLKTGDESTSQLRGDEAEEAEGRKKKKEKKALMAVLFDPFIVLYTGWRTYARQRVVFAGLAFATLFMTVLGFDSITTGYIYASGLSEVMVGLTMSLAGVTGILGTFAFTWFRRRVGLERTGLFAINFELLCLTLCVVSVWAPGSLFQPDSLLHLPRQDGLDNCSVVADIVPTVGNASDLTPYSDAGSRGVPQGCGGNFDPKEKISIVLFLIGVITSRVGLWMADLVVTQLLQETVRERERGIVNGVQNSLNMLMDVLKFTLVIVLPHIETFGYLIILSFIFICLASLFFALYSRSIRGHLLHCEKIFPCLKANNNTTHARIYKGEMTRTVTVDEP